MVLVLNRLRHCNLSIGSKLCWFW